jgi:hypothetical protein
MRKVKYVLAGTVDQVKAEIEALHTIGGNGELEWFGWFFDQGFMSWDEEMRQIEMFAKHIIPAFRDTDVATKAARTETKQPVA